ncbi:hypothetical protein PLESTB_001519300 [Pleodorina starrii]|uniref:Uncharacterized protein n=1 Tax=Pleodorina starrii TaxID=330485 RepID=A0A9W6BWS4_9CHLO|nr:hypothetical protein PLESTM_000982600 [Pleodorina starrii]GLC59659.1 hypothetical protein PLESTB_001519300 [Pleodorina starrii]GLC74625.1 hypothetical protein PLESTF_001536700 [Pleodorina starrii]
MPREEHQGLVSGASSSGTDGTSKSTKTNHLRGLICWGIFAAFLIFFIIMAAVYTDPKRYKEAEPEDYLGEEDRVLYNGLGQVYFTPSSPKLNAMAQFQLGLQLMHLFWYDLAIQKFQQARAMDPNFAMAYWGEAMCYKQPLWQTEDLASAQAVLAQLKKSQALRYASDREQQYVAAAQTLFAANVSLQDRETQYAVQMRILWDDNQDDPDACALAALAVLGKLQSVGNYAASNAATLAQIAENILDDCVYFFPNHAGAYHYQAHMYDVAVDDWHLTGTPSTGLAASVKLAKLAPKSNVAQHMASHFYVRTGNWSQAALSNQAAVAASDSYCNAVEQGNACDADNRWHALEWQLFSQTQQCGAKAAYTSYTRMQAVAKSMNYTGDYGQWLYRSYAHMQLQSLNSLGIIPLRNATDNTTEMLPPPLYNTGGIENAVDIADHFWPPHAEAHALLARVYALTFERNVSQLSAPGVRSTVAAALARLDLIVATQTSLVANSSANADAASANADMLALLTTVQLQAKAVVGASECAAKLSSCNTTSWMALMDQALMLHKNVSRSTTLPSLKIAPTPEFYGRLLDATGGNSTLAKQLFMQCLDELPGRMQCLLGLARSTIKLNDLPSATSIYSKLQTQCALGDKTFPALLEARSRTASPPPPAKKGLLRRSLREQAVAATA